MELLRLLIFGACVIAVLVGLLYCADLLHILGDEEASASDEDSTPGGFDGGAFHFDRADNLRELIGAYGNVPIHRYAEIGGAWFEFDHVCCAAGRMVVLADARCLAPGLVYSRARQDTAPR